MADVLTQAEIARAKRLVLNAEIAEGAIEAAFIAWHKSANCLRAGPCKEREECNVGKGKPGIPMCVQYREHLAKAVAEVM